MSFSEREILIFHCSVAMTMSTLTKNESFDMRRVVNEIIKNRCRKLSEEDVNNIFNDIAEEVRKGQIVFEEMIARMRGESLEDFK
tara:strand:- start:314 stop:568 length:255 start_codon:yes stop_codon:yes gene_type:complete